MYTPAVPHVHHWCTICTPPLYHMYTPGAPYVHTCATYAHTCCTICTHLPHHMYTPAVPYVQHLLYHMFTTGVPYVTHAVPYGHHWRTIWTFLATRNLRATYAQTMTFNAWTETTTPAPRATQIHNGSTWEWYGNTVRYNGSYEAHIHR